MLFFGYGSKINVLTNFINSALISNNVLVIKGFIPHLTIYDILAGLYNLYPMIEKKYKNIEKQVFSLVFLSIHRFSIFAPIYRIISFLTSTSAFIPLMALFSVIIKCMST